MTASTWRGPAAEIVKARIRGALNDRLETLFSYLFGSAGERRGIELRFPGTIGVVVKGRRRGMWRQWSGEAKGDPFAAIRFAQGCSVAEAWDWAARFCGIEPPDPSATPLTKAELREWHRKNQERIEAEAKRRAAEEAAEIARQLAEARASWDAAGPIAGTLGEYYLTVIRGIPKPPGAWPACIRWNQRKLALVVAATNAEGDLEATQEIILQPDASNRRRLDGSKIKLTYGPRRGRGIAVRLPASGDHDLGSPLQGGEGVETCLTGWRSNGYATQIWLGGPAMAQFAHGRLNIWFADDDAPGSPAARALEKKLAESREAGIRLAVAYPWAERRGDKSDFNDLLRAEGLDAVAHRIRLAQLEAEGLTSAPAPFSVPSASVAEVIAANARQLDQFALHRLDEDPPRIMLDGLPGSRKTELITKAAPIWAHVDRAAERPHRVFYLVPAHHLSREIEARFAEQCAKARLSLSVAVYRGRESEPPLCTNLDEIRLAQSAGVRDLTTAVCESGAVRAPCRAGCGFFPQLDQAARADIVVMAHNFVFQPPPKELLGGVGTVIIDEDFTGLGYAITELQLSEFSDAALRLYPVRHTKGDQKGEPDPEKTAELQDHFVRIRFILDQVGQGVALRVAIEAEGLTKETIEQIRGINWKRKIEPEMAPDMALS
jgi:putative DNA primase/helicase